MSACKSCDDGLPLYAMDTDGVSVRVAGSRTLRTIGHALDDYHWPCLLVPQPGARSERQRREMVREWKRKQKAVPA